MIKLKKKNSAGDATATAEEFFLSEDTTERKRSDLNGWMIASCCETSILKSSTSLLMFP